MARRKKTPLRDHSLFISYRRADTQATAGRIDEHLSAQFGKDAVFRDDRTIRGGDRIRLRIEETLAKVRVVLVLIGKQWLTLKDDEGRTRIEAPDDHLRTEIEIALASKTIRVVPILIEGASKPRREKLPASIRELDELNYLQVRSGTDFDRDMEELFAAVQAGLPRGTFRIWPQIRPAVFLLVALGLMYVAFNFGVPAGLSWLRARNAARWLTELVPTDEPIEYRDPGATPTPVTILPRAISGEGESSDEPIIVTTPIPDPKKRP